MVIAGNGIEIRVSDEVLIMARMAQQEEKKGTVEIAWTIEIQSRLLYFDHGILIVNARLQGDSTSGIQGSDDWLCGFPAMIG
jgi:hypothetical protein